MGIREVKAAFQETIEPDFNCTLATMDMVRVGKVESQVLFFRVKDANGAETEIRSDPIAGGGDLLEAARDTGMKLIIDHKKQKQE